MTQPWMWVDSPEVCDAVCTDIERSRCVALDTEYDSFRYFHGKLCLVQLSTEDMTYLFDPFECAAHLSPLKKYFSDGGIQTVLHAGDNDVRLLHRDYGFTFHNVFDTHRAAEVLGCPRLALATVIETYLGVSVPKPKKLQRSCWDCRPLSEEQIDYAVKDTRYLIELSRRLSAELRKENREEEAQHAFRLVAEARWQPKRFDRRGYLRVKGIDRLDTEGRERLSRLYAWRFRYAKQTNRALFMILSDTEMIDLSEKTVDSIAAMRKRGLLSEKKITAFGADVVATMNSDSN